jgi:hypothetical protein
VTGRAAPDVTESDSDEIVYAAKRVEMTHHEYRVVGRNEQFLAVGAP